MFSPWHDYKGLFLLLGASSTLYRRTRVLFVSVVRSLQFLLGMVVTVLTDIIHFGIFYPGNDMAIGRSTDVFRFSLGMAILNLLLKPVSCFFVYQMYRERGGDYNVNFGESQRKCLNESVRMGRAISSMLKSERYRGKAKNKPLNEERLRRKTLIVSLQP